MRTTLDIEDDVLFAAREHAARQGKSLGAVVSALAREALRRPQVAGPAVPGDSQGREPGRRQGGRYALLPQRDELITLEHLRSLQDEQAV